MTQPIIQPAGVDAALYAAAYASVVRFDDSARGRVRLTDRDRAALLQRLTTNDIEKLTPGDGARTVLVNSHARILDLLTVYVLPEHLLLTTNPGQGAAFTRFLQSRIFFNDRVGVENLSDTTIQIQLYGPESAALIRELSELDVQAWPLHHVQAAAIDGAAVWIARTLPIGGDGFVIIAEQTHAEAIRSALAAIPELDAATLDLLRIEHGYPAPRAELSTEYIPLETGLHDAVSFSKGCYTGQEIIARMESRNRLAKRLVGLRLDGDTTPGTPLSFEGREAGDLTSVAQSPRLGWIGLAYIRTAAATPGTQIRVGEQRIGEVVELPFAERDAGAA